MSLVLPPPRAPWAGPTDEKGPAEARAQRMDVPEGVLGAAQRYIHRDPSPAGALHGGRTEGDIGASVPLWELI